MGSDSLDPAVDMAQKENQGVNKTTEKAVHYARRRNSKPPH